MYKYSSFSLSLYISVCLSFCLSDLLAHKYVNNVVKSHVAAWPTSSLVRKCWNLDETTPTRRSRATWSLRRRRGVARRAPAPPACRAPACSHPPALLHDINNIQRSTRARWTRARPINTCPPTAPLRRGHAAAVRAPRERSNFVDQRCVYEGMIWEKTEFKTCRRTRWFN